jgi:hypothetical protein
VKAWQVIEKHGWTRHTYGCDSIGYCALGAISKAYPNISEARYDAMVNKINAETGNIGVAQWNDVHATRRKVINLLKKLDI